ncbi:sugar transferase [Alsobacter soli]|uniref:Sugar transferase n=1 Tax=Alsobacter soli TaxID=2109933 RepID=A0A2T1HQT6_9HYPH|nr:sugar transferase [Alsobacter soli]PSC04013.1 sugar transferase [Alsobacter soli]
MQDQPSSMLAVSAVTRTRVKEASALAPFATPSGVQGFDLAAEQTTTTAELARRGPDTGAAVGGWPKRVLDLAIALLALVLLLPIMLFIMALIRAKMGGPVIYSHTRVGQNGRPFSCLKFRTMVKDSDLALRRHLASDPAAAREWREFRKLHNDPRVTPLGAMLRKSSLDELPQLFNVLRGDMSCVGPRPVPADELERYGAHAADYARARPGLTGLWQTSGRNLRTYEERIALDCEYVQNWSLWSDVVILAKTIPAVMNFDETA